MSFWYCSSSSFCSVINVLSSAIRPSSRSTVLPGWREGTGGVGGPEVAEVVEAAEERGSSAGIGGWLEGAGRVTEPREGTGKEKPTAGGDSSAGRVGIEAAGRGREEETEPPTAGRRRAAGAEPGTGGRRRPEETGRVTRAAEADEEPATSRGNEKRRGGAKGTEPLTTGGGEEGPRESSTAGREASDEEDAPPGASQGGGGGKMVDRPKMVTFVATLSSLSSSPSSLMQRGGSERRLSEGERTSRLQTGKGQGVDHSWVGLVSVLPFSILSRTPSRSRAATYSLFRCFSRYLEKLGMPCGGCPSSPPTSPCFLCKKLGYTDGLWRGTSWSFSSPPGGIIVVARVAAAAAEQFSF